MKRYFYLLTVALFAALLISLTSCGNDDEPDVPDNSPSIIGKWNVSRTVLKYYFIDPETGEENTSDEVEEGVGETFEFTDSSLIIHDPAYPDEDEIYKYIYNEATGIILIDGGSNFKIAKLTSNTLHLVSEISETGMSVTMTIELEKP